MVNDTSPTSPPVESTSLSSLAVPFCKRLLRSTRSSCWTALPRALAYRFCFQVQPRSVFFAQARMPLHLPRRRDRQRGSCRNRTDGRHRRRMPPPSQPPVRIRQGLRRARMGLPGRPQRPRADLRSGPRCRPAADRLPRLCPALPQPFVGRTPPGIATADILAALHPTAAVNGHPRKTALQHLRSREPFARGWYAGPVGWIGADASEFAVAIRSARVLGDQVSLFAGAGIVPGSDPDGEWAETESKLSLFLNALV